MRDFLFERTQEQVQVCAEAAGSLGGGGEFCWSEENINVLFIALSWREKHVCFYGENGLEMDVCINETWCGHGLDIIPSCTEQN